jgi:actin-related protein
MFDGNALVIENGSWQMKAGWAGASEPSAVFPSVVGHNYGVKTFDFDCVPVGVGHHSLARSL